MLRIDRNLCPYCRDSSHIYLSRVKTFLDLGAILLLLRPVRCHSCLGRFYRPVFVKTLPPPQVRRKTQQDNPAQPDSHFPAAS
jgi:hypothetical protein